MRVVDRLWRTAAPCGRDSDSLGPCADDPRITHHPVTDVEIVDAGADVGDPPDQLGAHDDRQLRTDKPRQATRRDSSIPGADAHRGDANRQLTRLRRRR